VKGLYARRQTEAGRITFGFRYRDAGGVVREVKIGVAGALTPDDARKAAKVHAGAVAKAESPAAARDAARAVKTWAQVWDDYAATGLLMRKPRVQVHYRALWDNHLAPRLSSKRVTDLSRLEVEKLHRDITDLAAASALAHAFACVLAPRAPAPPAAAAFDRIPAPKRTQRARG
jgi:hypothetical protein